MLPHDLLLQLRRQRAPITRAHALEAGDEPALEWLGIANSLRVQQAGDAIGVAGTLLQQPIALTRGPPAVLILRRGHAHHAAHPRLAAQVTQQRAHQLLQIDPIRLRPPRATVDLNARRVDLVIDHPLSGQPAVQPVTVVTGLIAGDDSHRLACRRRLSLPFRKMRA